MWVYQCVHMYRTVEGRVRMSLAQRAMEGLHVVKGRDCYPCKFHVSPATTTTPPSNRPLLAAVGIHSFMPRANVQFST